MKVRVGESVSQSKQTDLGIPQRWLLIVTLFLVVINIMLGELGNGVDEPLVVDDLVIYITARYRRVAARALHGVTNKLDAWAAERSLTFSPNKTVSVIFRKKNEESLETKLRNKIIPSKENTQFLGMTTEPKQREL